MHLGYFYNKRYKRSGKMKRLISCISKMLIIFNLKLYFTCENNLVVSAFLNIGKLSPSTVLRNSIYCINLTLSQLILVQYLNWYVSCIFPITCLIERSKTELCKTFDVVWNILILTNINNQFLHIKDTWSLHVAIITTTFFQLPSFFKDPSLLIFQVFW